MTFSPDSPAPSFPDRLARVAAGSAHRISVQLRKKLLIQSAAKVFFVITAAIHDGAKQHRRDDASLRQLARFQSRVITIRLGVSVTGNPVPVVAPQLLKIIYQCGPTARASPINAPITVPAARSLIAMEPPTLASIVKAATKDASFSEQANGAEWRIPLGV